MVEWLPMTVLADAWPLLLIAGFGLVLFAVVRLIRRFSPGAVSAGPKMPPNAANTGQSDAAADLRRIERRLDTRPESLIERIEGSCHEVGVSTAGVAPGTSAERHIEILLDRLEHELGFTIDGAAIDGATIKMEQT